MSEERDFWRFAYFCSCPIFCAGKTVKTLFFARCSMETLATKAMIHRLKGFVLVTADD